MSNRMDPDQLQWVLDHNAQIRGGHRVQIADAATAWREDRALRDRLCAALKLAQPEFCSMRCPSVFRGPDSARHLPECTAMQTIIAEAAHETR